MASMDIIAAVTANDIIINFEDNAQIEKLARKNKDKRGIVSRRRIASNQNSGGSV